MILPGFFITLVKAIVMPFKSKAQLEYLKKNEPEIYRQWIAENPEQDLSRLPDRITDETYPKNSINNRLRKNR